MARVDDFTPKVEVKPIKVDKNRTTQFDFACLVVKHK